MTRDPQSRQRPDKIKAKVKAADTREHKEKINKKGIQEFKKFQSHTKSD